MKVSEYNYKLPEDYTIKPKTRKWLDKYATKHGLSNRDMQEIIDVHIELTEEFVQEYVKELRRLFKAIAFKFFMFFIPSAIIVFFITSLFF